jgi:phospholipid/cholesterol/gamma-HCH transport system permease protein
MASTVSPPRDRQTTALPVAGRVGRGLSEPVAGALGELGELSRFAGRTAVATPAATRYFAEVLRQAALLITGSAVVLLAMQFVIGMTCGLEGSYVLRGFGASSYVGAYTNLCGVRETAALMFGFMASAKIGCGLAAEIGAMRISEEIDALETLAIQPMAFLMATRLLAAWLTIPVFFVLGEVFTTLGAAFVVLVQIREVSPGAWAQVHWGYTTFYDLAVVGVKFWTIITTVVIVGMYFGWRAEGGPAGVGTAAARSMLVNLVASFAINSAITAIAWGVRPNLPIGG